jgi:hypothetical protein
VWAPYIVSTNQQFVLDVIRDLGQPHGRRPYGQGGKDDELVRKIAIHRRPTVQILEERPGDTVADGLSRAAAGPGLIRPKEAVRAFGKQGQHRPSLRRGVVVEETDVGLEASPGEARLTGVRHALADLPLLQVGGEG